MATTNFTSGTIIESSWLNDVDATVYEALDGATTPAEVRNFINVPQKDGTDATGTWPISITGNAATSSDLSGGALGSIPYQSGSGATDFLAAGTQGLAVVSGGATAPIYGIPVLRGYIDGLTMSTAGSSATMTISAGVASNSTNVFVLNLSASINKTTSSWAVGTGNGGLDTGVIANSTWYYFYVIRRPDTGVVDVVFSTNSSTPTLPANYTQYRYIGAGKTDGAAQWTKFLQLGDCFYWDSLPLDIDTTTSTSAVIDVLPSVPLGRKMTVFLAISHGAAESTLFSDPDQANNTPSLTTAPLVSIGSASGAHSGQVKCNTDISGRIRRRSITGGVAIRVVVRGWLDLRGKSA